MELGLAWPCVVWWPSFHKSRISNVIVQQLSVVLPSRAMNSACLMFLLTVRVVLCGKVDLDEVFKEEGESRPLFEDVVYDQSIAFEIFMDEDESFNIEDRSREGPKAPTFDKLKPETTVSAVTDLSSNSGSKAVARSTAVVLFVYLTNVNLIFSHMNQNLMV